MSQSALPTTTTVTRARLFALIGDLAAIAAFAMLARAAHHDRLEFTFIGWVQTVWPFLTGLLVGWAVVQVKKLAATRVWPAGVIVWLSALSLGLVLWGIMHSKVPHWSFAIVAASMSGLLLLGWRGLARAITRRRD